MGTLYDELAASTPPAPQPAGGGFYDALASQERQQQGLRATVAATAAMTPNRAAQLNQLARTTGLPRAVVETAEGEAKARAQFQELWDASADSPVLRARLLNPQFTELATDDVGTLSQIERGMRAGLHYMMGGGQGNGVFGDVKAGYHRSSAAAAGAFRGVAEVLATPFDFLEPVAAIGGNPLRRLAEGFAGIAQDQTAVADRSASRVFGVSSGVQSLVQNSKYLPLALLGPVGGAAALSGMVAESFGASYQKGREAGLSEVGSLVYGASDAAVEYATERLPVSRLIGDLAVDTGIVKMLGRQLALEIPGEQVATVLQDMNEWAVLHPERSFREYLADRPSAAAETLIATVIGTGGNVALAKTVDTALNGFVQEQLRQTEAGERAAGLQQQLQVALQSKLRERDPEQFRDAVAEMARQAGAESIYVDAQVLNQLPREVLEQLSGVQAQLADALATNAPVELRIADVLTVAPGTGLEQVVAQNMRATPDALTATEAAQAGEQAQQLLAQEAQRVIDQATNAVQASAAAELVKAQVLQDLNAAGRFGADVNDAYATLVRDFYTVLGQRLGINTQQAFERYRLQVVAQTPAGAQLDQDVPIGPLRHPGQAPALAEVLSQWDAAGVQHTVSEKGDTITVSKIVVPEDGRGAGKGTAAMQALVQYADATGKHIVLSPAADFGGSVPRLVKFYKRFGFVENKGRNRAFSTMESMYRQAPGKVLYQGNKVEVTRGTFNPATNTIALLQAADLSTFLHESGHAFLEILANVSAQPGAPADVQADMAALLKWFGVADLATWRAMTLEQKRPHHERFAESFEQYLLEGKAPNRELRPLFRKFRAYLARVYRSLQAFAAGRDLQLSDDVRRVMDRLLATDDQIAEAQRLAGMAPDLDATDAAVERLQARSVRDLKWAVNARSKVIKKLQEQARATRKAVEDEVRAEVEAMPEVQAKAALDTLRKSTPEHKAALADWKARRQAVVDQATEQITATLLASEGAELKGLKKGQFLAKNRRRIANEAEGQALAWERENPRPERQIVGSEVEVATLADSFGYPSVDAMLEAIQQFGRKEDVIEGMTDQRMLERHGDLVDQNAIEQAATEAVHNEARARALATELAAQRELLTNRRDTGQTNAAGRPVTVNATLEAARQFAAEVASRKKAKDLKAAAWAHLQAERRAAKAWEAATAKGDTQAAVQAKQDQLLNHEVYRALQEAKAKTDSANAFFAKILKGSTEKLVERGLDPDVVSASRAILAAYGLAPKVGKSAMEYMEAVEKNDPEMHAVLRPSVDAALAMAKPYDELTVGEIDALVAELEAMQLLARRSRQMEVDGNLLDIEEAADQLRARMAVIGVPLEVPGETGALTPKEERTRWLQFARALTRRIEQWAEGMDGGRGPFTKLVFGPVKAAADRYRADRVQYRREYQRLLDNVAPALRKGPIAAPELGYTFGQGHNGIGHAELLHALLHTGNESNKRKLLLGRKWAVEREDGTLDTSKWDTFVARMQRDGLLAKAHYDFAQGVWDLLERTKPLAQKAHRDVFGRYFAEITADAFETPYGAYRGGYVPAQADPRIATDAALRKLAEMENENMAFSFPTTSKGFTKARVDYNRPLILDLRTIGQHLDKVLLFAHMEPAVRDVNRLLRAKGVMGSLSRIDPAAYEGALIPWLNRAARQQVETPIAGDGRISRILSVARSRAGMSLMFANLSNTAQQITGFSLAAVKVKPRHLLAASAQYISAPAKLSTFVGEASIYMRDRMTSEVAAMHDAMEDILLDPSAYKRAQNWTQKHAYFLQSAVDNVMSPIVWTGAYNQALEAGESEAEAVKAADAAVRQTQGSTLPEDVSRFETGPAYARMFTQFAGYFNMVANTNGAELRKIASDIGLKKGAGKALYVVTLGLLVPVWVAEAIALAFRGGPEDEDGDGWLDDWLASVFGMGTIKGSLAMVPFVGQAINAGIARANNNPADDRISLSPAVSMIEGAVGSPVSVYKAMFEDGNWRTAVRDVATLLGMATGLPTYAVARPLGYAAGVAQGKVDPTSAADAARGMATGAVSPDSR